MEASGWWSADTNIDTHTRDTLVSHKCMSTAEKKFPQNTNAQASQVTAASHAGMHVLTHTPMEAEAAPCTGKTLGLRISNATQ